MRNDADTGMAARGSAQDMDVGLGQTLTGNDDDAWARDGSGELSKDRSRTAARRPFFAAICGLARAALCRCSV
uniref:Predicted protein n=1 Tax=Hordeum vulgare subsp. vulgare TaxID=112509 RepID=F2EJX4_HORVV|nr:predicted protein [Hordeum vulgare subsp. vulgare]